MPMRGIEVCLTFPIFDLFHNFKLTQSIPRALARKLPIKVFIHVEFKKVHWGWRSLFDVIRNYNISYLNTKQNGLNNSLAYIKDLKDRVERKVVKGKIFTIPHGRGLKIQSDHQDSTLSLVNPKGTRVDE